MGGSYSQGRELQPQLELMAIVRLALILPTIIVLLLTFNFASGSGERTIPSKSVHPRTVGEQVSEIGTKGLPLDTGASLERVTYIGPSSLPTCGPSPSWVNVYPPNANDNTTNIIKSVSAIASNDIWATGWRTGDSSNFVNTLIEHWNGTDWDIIPSPNLGLTATLATNHLLGVAALSPSNAWAVGDYRFSTSSDGGGGSLIEHWDGALWSIVTNPYTATLRSISAVSADDIWAVGEYSPSISGPKTFVLHWDGSQWSQIPSPNPAPENHNQLHAVVALSSEDVWAVGYYDTSAVPGGATLIEHWNGVEWSVVPSPNPNGGGSILYGITALSANDIWAVGGGVQDSLFCTLTLHWDGNQWSIVPSPRIDPGSSHLTGVTAIATDNVWAVGDFYDFAGTNGTLIAHWNGSLWETVASQDPTNSTFLFDVTKVSANDIWAVGYYELHSMSNSLLLAKHYTSSCPSATPTPGTPTPCAIAFSDVPENHTFYPFVRCLACRGILSGYDDGTFRPENEITRGQIAKVVSNAAAIEDDPGPQLYEDVDLSNTFFIWVNRLSNRGYMSGYPCGGAEGEPCNPPGDLPYFRPFANATRGQLAKIVANAAEVVGTPTGLFYTDVPDTHPFYLWIMRLTDLGVMSGYACGGEGEPCDDQQRPYFRPYNDVTRGQASKIVANTFFPGCATPQRR